MSARTPLGPICRALKAPSRASPVAGPSRLPIVTFTRSVQTDTSYDRFVSTRLVARTSQPLTSILQAYAVLRSIETNYGQVITFDVNRDPDSLLPTNILFFTMAEPVNLDKAKDTLHEIPSPRSSVGVMERYGGPSLGDIRSVLRDDPSRISKVKGQNQKQSSITFRVELRRKTGWNQPLPLKKKTPTTIKQDTMIAEALEKFGDGFFGGFEGLGKKHLEIARSWQERGPRDSKAEGKDRRRSKALSVATGKQEEQPEATEADRVQVVEEPVGEGQAEKPAQVSP